MMSPNTTRKMNSSMVLRSCISQEKGEKIDLHLKAALFTFESQKPTMEEYLNWPEEDIIDIAVEDWNPQEHTDDVFSTPRDYQTESELVQVNNSAVDSMENYLIHDPLEEYFDTMEEKFLKVF